MKQLKYRMILWKSLVKFCDRNSMYVGVIFCSVLLAFIQTGETKIYGLFIDDVLVSKKMDALIVTALALIILAITRTATGAVSIALSNILAKNTIMNIRKDILNKVLGRSWEQTFNSDNGKDKVCLLDSIDKIESFIRNSLSGYIVAFITIIICMSLMLTIDIPLAFAGFIIIPITIFLDQKVSCYEKKENVTNRICDERIHDLTLSIAMLWKEIREFGQQKKIKYEMSDALHKKAIANSRWINCWVLRVKTIPQLKNDFFMQIFVYCLGGLLVYKGNISIGELLVYGMYFNMLAKSVSTMSASQADLKSDMPYIDSVLNILNEKQIEIRTDNVHSTERICADMISYCYGDKKIVFNTRANFIKGMLCGICGESGGGKTTLLKLITGQLKASQGKILYNRTPVNDMTEDEVFKNVSAMMQDNRIFTGTVKENFQYIMQNITDEEIAQACKKAGINDFIESLPDKYDHLLEENGANLSGGQRQRLIFARTIAKSADVYIFDEPTSALDENSEYQIIKALHELAEKNIVIVVTHSQKVLKECDVKYCIG